VVASCALVTAGCGGGPVTTSVERARNEIPPQPALTWVDGPASPQLLRALNGAGMNMGWFSCYDDERGRLSDAECKQETYEAGDVLRPTQIRVRAELPLPHGTSYFLSFLDDRGKACYDIEVIRKGADSFPLHCGRIRNCDALCLWTYAEFQGGEQVVGGPVPEDVASVRITPRAGEAREYRLVEPPLPEFAGRRLLMVAYQNDRFPTFAGFDSNHELVAECPPFLACRQG
jgi:hypothetical protein